jgi:hypothetical protein
MQAVEKAPETKEPFFWLSDQHPTTPVPAQNPVCPNLLNTIMDDIKIPLIVTSISLVAAFIFRSPPLWTFTICSTAHLLTRVAKNLLEDYAIWGDIEQIGLDIVRELPYLHLIAAIVAFVFSWYLPFVSMVIACSIGVLTGVNAEVISMQASYEGLRQMLNID